MIGSTRIATTSLLFSAIVSIARTSLYGARTKPLSSGSNPACTLRLPVAVSVAIVRPWNDPSIAMIVRFVDVAAVTVEARDLDRAFVRLGAGIAQERAVHSRHFGEAFCEAFLQRDLVQVRRVHQTAGLTRDCLGDFRMRMTQTGHGQSRERVEIFVTLLVEQVSPSP